jgi:hypothetical protein
MSLDGAPRSPQFCRLQAMKRVEAEARDVEMVLSSLRNSAPSRYGRTRSAARGRTHSLGSQWLNNVFGANESLREFYYQKPRPGMLEAGAHPDDLLFKGQINDGQISGIAYIFSAQCGQVPFHVKGPALDNGSKIVLTGQAPHVGRNCQTTGEYTSTLEFKLLKTSEVTQAPPCDGADAKR